MSRLLSNVSVGCFVAAIVAAGLEVVYGYFFGLWRGIISTAADAGTMAPTKTGETVLWAFLTFAFLGISHVSLALAQRSD